MAIGPLIGQEIVRRVIGTKRLVLSDPGDSGGPDIPRNVLTDQQILSAGIRTRETLVSGRAAFFAAQRIRPSSTRGSVADIVARFATLGRVPRFALRRFVSLQPPGRFATSLRFRPGGSFRSLPSDRLSPENLAHPSLAERLEDPDGLS